MLIFFIVRGCKMEQTCKSEDFRRNESQKHETVADEIQINANFVFLLTGYSFKKVIFEARETF